MLFKINHIVTIKMTKMEFHWTQEATMSKPGFIDQTEKKGEGFVDGLECFRFLHASPLPIDNPFIL